MVSDVQKRSQNRSAYALVVYDLNNHGEATEVRAVGEEHDATDFDVPPCGGVYLDFGHLVDLNWQKVSIKAGRTVNARHSRGVLLCSESLPVGEVPVISILKPKVRAR